MKLYDVTLKRTGRTFLMNEADIEKLKKLGKINNVIVKEAKTVKVKNIDETIKVIKPKKK